MKKLFCLTILALVCLTTEASEENKKIQVERILELTKSESMLDSMYSQVMQMQTNLHKELGVKENEKHLFAAHNNKLLNFMKKEMGWGQIKEPIVELYMQNFTEIELIDIVAFYESSTGQSLVEKMPIVTQQSVNIAQNIIVKKLPKLELLSQEFAKELKDFREEQKLKASSK